jgi:hypothetical protein
MLFLCFFALLNAFPSRVQRLKRLAVEATPSLLLFVRLIPVHRAPCGDAYRVRETPGIYLYPHKHTHTHTHTRELYLSILVSLLPPISLFSSRLVLSLLNHKTRKAKKTSAARLPDIYGDIHSLTHQYILLHLFVVVHAFLATIRILRPCSLHWELQLCITAQQPNEQANKQRRTHEVLALLHFSSATATTCELFFLFVLLAFLLVLLL